MLAKYECVSVHSGPLYCLPCSESLRCVWRRTKSFLINEGYVTATFLVSSINVVASTAIKSSKKACAMINSGNKMVMVIHWQLRKIFFQVPSFAAGTFRCWTLHVHAKIVVPQLRIISQVPRRLGLPCHPRWSVVEASLATAGRASMKMADTNDIVAMKSVFWPLGNSKALACGSAKAVYRILLAVLLVYICT